VCSLRESNVGEAANILNEQSGTADKGRSSSWGLDVGLTTDQRKNKLVTQASDLGEFLG
jgi:hypothetical protein